MQTIYSLLDPQTGKYLTQEQAAPESACTLAPDRLEVRTPNGSVTGNSREMRIVVKFSGLDVNINLLNHGPMLANLGTGLIPALGDINYEYAFPNMPTKGEVVLDGIRYPVTGTSWFDRQWGAHAPLLRTRLAKVDLVRH